MIRILIIDDHAIVREGLRGVLESAPDLRVAAEAASSAEALQHLHREPFDLVILDLSLPDRDGFDTLKTIKANWPRLPVLVYTLSKHEDDAFRALHDGAMGYLIKEDPTSQIPVAVREILAGRRFLSPTVAHKLALSRASDQGRPPHESLTDREREIFLLFVNGHQPAFIANRLSLSVKTVYTHEANIRAKLHATTALDLLRYALKYKLIE